MRQHRCASHRNEPAESIHHHFRSIIGKYIYPATYHIHQPTSHPPPTATEINSLQSLAYHVARVALWLAGVLFDRVAPALANYAAGKPAQQIQFPAERNLELGMPNSPVTSEVTSESEEDKEEW